LFYWGQYAYAALGVALLASDVQIADADESVGAAVEIDVAPLLPPVIGDRARLQNARTTMLVDAMRATGALVR
jgi:hypothetical protein